MPPVILQNMADKPSGAPKTQIDLVAYAKSKEKRAKDRMKLRFPKWVILITAVPAAYLVFMVVYFLVHLRFVAEH